MEVSPGRPGNLPGVNIERGVRCGAVASRHLPGGFGLQFLTPCELRRVELVVQGENSPGELIS